MFFAKTLLPNGMVRIFVDTLNGWWSVVTTLHSGPNQPFLWNGCIGCIYFVKILANSAPTRAGWPPQTSVSPWAALTTTALHIKYFLSKLQKAAVDSKASDLRSPIPSIPHCRQLFIARLETQAVTLDLQIFCLWGCGARLPSCYLVQQILCNRILEMN